MNFFCRLFSKTRAPHREDEQNTRNCKLRDSPSGIIENLKKHWGFSHIQGYRTETGQDAWLGCSSTDATWYPCWPIHKTSPMRSLPCWADTIRTAQTASDVEHLRQDCDVVTDTLKTQCPIDSKWAPCQPQYHQMVVSTQPNYSGKYEWMDFRTDARRPVVAQDRIMMSGNNIALSRTRVPVDDQTAFDTWMTKSIYYGKDKLRLFLRSVFIEDRRQCLRLRSDFLINLLRDALEHLFLKQRCVYIGIHQDQNSDSKFEYQCNIVHNINASIAFVGTASDVGFWPASDRDTSPEASVILNWMLNEMKLLMLRETYLSLETLVALKEHTSFSMDLVRLIVEHLDFSEWAAEL